MAAYSFLDRESSILFEASVKVNGVYPPTMHVNMIPFQDGKPNRQAALWLALKPQDQLKLYQNITDPNSYGAVMIQMGQQTVSIGYKDGVISATGYNGASYSVSIDTIALQSLQSYLNSWLTQGCIVKDLYENLSINFGNIVKTAILDVCDQLNINLQRELKVFPPVQDTSGRTNQGGGYQKNNNYQRNNNFNNNNNNIGSLRTNPFPPKQQSIPSMPTMNPMGGIPTNPNPQPQQIPMGMGIPQSPAGQSSQAMNDEVNAMIQNVFNGGNGLM